MYDEHTPHVGLPLPSGGNELATDVERLRAALIGIDDKFRAFDVLLHSDDATLDQVQGLVDAIKANRTTVDGLLSGKADSAAFNALVARVVVLEAVRPMEETQVLQAGQTDVDLLTIPSTDGISVFIDGIRLKGESWTRHPTIKTRFKLAQAQAFSEITITR